MPGAPSTPLPDLTAIRRRMRDLARGDETARIAALADATGLNEADRAAIAERAAALVSDIRETAAPTLMESFLGEYGLSTTEGIALMCLAEAFLRVPDAATLDDLIADKIAPSDWSSHLGHSASPLVNASTWALMITGRVIRPEQADQPKLASVLHGLVRRLGEPVVRRAVAQAMRELGRQFVLGADIASALDRARPREAQGVTHSFDMLGEAARTAADATRYFDSYAATIAAVAPHAKGLAGPGISVKLSALHPRYEAAQHRRVLDELVPRLGALARQAADAGMGLAIDAEEAERLELSLDVIQKVLADKALAGWDGFGIVVQAYGRRAPAVIDWVEALAAGLHRRVTLRLVKGAYWDTEIKRAQVLGLDRYPVHTRKAATDAAYLACARRLFAATDRIYPQFATHNAHTVQAVLHMARQADLDPARNFEFQRLHGMGEALHDIVRERHGTRLRIYAPVGDHRDLLAYLVRRLLENGANSSFVHQIVDAGIPAGEVARDPLDALATAPAAALPRPADLFAPARRNSRGWDLADADDLARFEAARAPFRRHRWQAAPRLAAEDTGQGPVQAILNPADPADIVGTVAVATTDQVESAMTAAGKAFSAWSARPAADRAAILERAADLYEDASGEFFALLAREAGKTPPDAVAELREAVDFLRYYAAETRRAGNHGGRGLFACISPWNFPLAIFTGQVAAALAAGNAVIAKPAEQTPLVADLAVALLHRAGVPGDVLQSLPGDGATVGAALAASADLEGLCFTGSTDTAQAINRAMAAQAAPGAPIIAETGGLNAMIVDSTALPEQAVHDAVASALQSAGQRCSALRILYVQEEVADRVLTMLTGAMDELALGDPWDLGTDVGPLIDDEAQAAVAAYCAAMTAAGRLVHRGGRQVPAAGRFVAPHLFRVAGIEDLEHEVFGPVLHVATFPAGGLDRVVDAINARGYGLTLGLHSRVDARVQAVVARARVGNIYVNRNQIGAVVGVQPFGGEGLSGTGPKAGGPFYLDRFRAASAMTVDLAPRDLPGPTGESNRLSLHPRGRFLCLDARPATLALAATARDLGNDVDLDAACTPQSLIGRAGVAGVIATGPAEDLRVWRRALAARPGPLVPLICAPSGTAAFVLERCVSVDTTAAGGNAQLLAREGA